MSQWCVSGKYSHFELQNMYVCVCMYVHIIWLCVCVCTCMCSHAQELLCCWMCQPLFQGLWAQVLSLSNRSTDTEQRMRWLAAVVRKNWIPTEYSRLCSAHFIRGVKSNDPTCPDYVPLVFSHVNTPKKKRIQQSMLRYQARKATKRDTLKARGRACP